MKKNSEPEEFDEDEFWDDFDEDPRERRMDQRDWDNFWAAEDATWD